MATIFFDLDGTLIDVRARHYRAYRHACAVAGFISLPAKSYWSRRRAGASTFALGPGMGTPRTLFRQAWLDVIERPDYLTDDRSFEWTDECLRELGARYRLVLVTLRRDRGALLEQVESLGLAAFFAGILVPEGDAQEKAELIRQWGYSEGDVVAGDTEADIDAARALGITAASVASGVRSAGFLRKLKPQVLAPALDGVVPSLMRRDVQPTKR
jgi:phosphoglycolate phosphatase-like HAD superfamily hydrolase